MNRIYGFYENKGQWYFELPDGGEFRVAERDINALCEIASTMQEAYEDLEKACKESNKTLPPLSPSSDT